MPRIGGGLVAAFEVLLANHAVRNLIREGKTRQIRNVIAQGAADGMFTLEASLTHLVERGYVSYEDATARAILPGEISAPHAGRTRGPHGAGRHPGRLTQTTTRGAGPHGSAPLACPGPDAEEAGAEAPASVRSAGAELGVAVRGGWRPTPE